PAPELEPCYHDPGQESGSCPRFHEPPHGHPSSGNVRSRHSFRSGNPTENEDLSRVAEQASVPSADPRTRTPSLALRRHRPSQRGLLAALPCCQRCFFLALPLGDPR